MRRGPALIPAQAANAMRRYRRGGTAGGEAGRQTRGFALLIVLWTMGLLALLVAQFTSAGRTEVRVAMNLQANAVAQAAADAALYEAILRLLQGAWLPDGRPHIVQWGNTAVTVRVKNQAWKVNPNLATAPVLRALLVQLGLDSAKSAALAQAIVDWRTPLSQPSGAKLAPYRAANLPYGPANRPFDSVDELGLVLGMTPGLLARMRPFLSVYQEGDAAEMLGNPIQAAALDAPLIGDGWQLGSSGRVMVALVEASAVGATGGRFTRRSVVRLRAEPSLEQPAYEVLTWEAGTE
jgi:general secretion pathway protein K